MRGKCIDYSVQATQLLAHDECLYGLTLLQQRMDDLSVSESREVPQQGGLKASHLLLVRLWSGRH